MKKLNKTLTLGFVGLMCLFFSYTGHTYDGDWYVSTDGTGQGTNGWADATNSLQGAITACGSNYTVWVSNGIYNPANLNVGGGVTVRSKTDLPTDVIFNGNEAGRVVIMNASSWLIGCTITNGNSDMGGGVNGGFVSNCIITGSKAGVMTQGGGAYNCTIYNSLISGNSAGYSGGGGQLCTFYNSTISGNTADSIGGGGFNCTFINSISWNNNNTDYFTGIWSNFYSCGEGYTGTGSITNDPLFVGGTNYRLQASSPCKDTGNNEAWIGITNSTDLDDNKRIWPLGGTVDMGAYEYGSQKDYPNLPSKPINPIPTNNAINQLTTTIVNWNNGDTNTTGYIINFGLSGNMINCGSTAFTNYNPGTLLYGSNYQWRIDATNTDGTTTGDVWNFTVKGELIIIEKNKLIVSNDFQVTGDSVLNNAEVDGTYKKILKVGNTATTVEKLYQWDNNAWVATINTNENQCNKMMGIALGANSTANGMLTMGDLTVTNTDLSPGAVIYVGSTAGEWTQTVPTNSAYIIRVIGYAIETNKIYIKPDGIWGLIE